MGGVAAPPTHPLPAPRRARHLCLVRRDLTEGSELQSGLACGLWSGPHCRGRQLRRWAPGGWVPRWGCGQRADRVHAGEGLRYHCREGHLMASLRRQPQPRRGA